MPGPRNGESLLFMKCCHARCPRFSQGAQQQKGTQEEREGTQAHPSITCSTLACGSELIGPQAISSFCWKLKVTYSWSLIFKKRGGTPVFSSTLPEAFLLQGPCDVNLICESQLCISSGGQSYSYSITKLHDQLLFQ